jgi:hypothetical protein
MNQELGQEHLGWEIWDNTVIHNENNTEERIPHIEESMGQWNPGIPVARESPKRGLRRRRWRFGERKSGVEEDTKRYLHPDPSFYRLTARGRNSGPRAKILAPRNFWGKWVKFLVGQKF